MADRIAELSHTGQQKFNFDDMLGDGDMKAMMIQAVAEMLDRREDLVEVRDHYLGMAGQSDFTVTAKPTQEMKRYCPLEIQAEPQIYETDWDQYLLLPLLTERFVYIAGAFSLKLYALIFVIFAAVTLLLVRIMLHRYISRLPVDCLKGGENV